MLLLELRKLSLSRNITSLAMTSPDEYSPAEYEVICRLSGGQTLFSSRFIVDAAFMKQAIRF
jgi:hypothetical protein